MSTKRELQEENEELREKLEEVYDTVGGALGLNESTEGKRLVMMETPMNSEKE